MPNDFIPNHLSFDTAGFENEFRKCLNIAMDGLSADMHDVWCTVISQCSEAANVMIIEAQKNVREINREITSDHAMVEVGIDEGAIAGGEREFIMVMVTLHGNGQVWTKPGAQTWKKYVAYKGPNKITVAYHISQFDQKDHSDVMVKSFEHDMKRYIRAFERTLYGLLDSIDYDKYVKVS